MLSVLSTERVTARPTDGVAALPGGCSIICTWMRCLPARISPSSSCECVEEDPATDGSPAFVVDPRSPLAHVL